MTKKGVVSVIAVGFAIALAGCGKATPGANHRPGELSVSEKLENVCYELPSQLRAALSDESNVRAPNLSGRGDLRQRLHRAVQLGEKEQLEHAAQRSAAVMIAIRREVLALPIPARVRRSAVAFEDALQEGSTEYRKFARRLHTQPARSDELRFGLEAYRQPQRSAEQACGKAVHDAK